MAECSTRREANPTQPVIHLPPIPEDSDTSDDDWHDGDSDASGSERSGEELVYDGEEQHEGDETAAKY